MRSYRQRHDRYTIVRTTTTTQGFWSNTCVSPRELVLVWFCVATTVVAFSPQPQHVVRGR